jgi:hypothetical protein
LPCTVLNIALAAIASVLVGAVIPLLGVGAFLAALLVIGIRGYLIPGTPTLTARYLPESVHRLFGHDGIDTDQPIGFDVEASLKTAGIIVECLETDDLCLTDRYRSTLQEEIRELRETSVQRKRLAESISVPERDVSFSDEDHGWFVLVEGTRAGGWDSRAAFIADLANQSLLSSALPNWDALYSQDRTQLLAALRSFIEVCPDCGGDVVPDEDVVRSCCRDDVVSVTTACVECDTTVFKGTGN